MFQKQRLLKLNNHLAHLKIPIIENCKYPKITIYTENSDLDLKRQMKKIYANANLLLRRFSCNNASEMFMNLNIRSFDEMLRIFTFGFISRVIVSNNVLIDMKFEIALALMAYKLRMSIILTF